MDDRNSRDCILFISHQKQRKQDHTTHRLLNSHSEEKAETQNIQIPCPRYMAGKSRTKFQPPLMSENMSMFEALELCLSSAPY